MTKGPGGEQEQGHWEVLQVQEEGYESSLSFRRRVAKYHKVQTPQKIFFTNHHVSNIWQKF